MSWDGKMRFCRFVTIVFAISSQPKPYITDKAKMSRAAFLAHQVVNSGTKLSKPRTSQGEYDIPELSDKALGIKKQVNENTPTDTVAPDSSSDAKDTTDGGYKSQPPPVDIEKMSIVDDNPPSAVPDDDVADDFTVLREKYIAIYQYLPQNEDELELLQGDSVLVVEKCDDGWYVGTCERTGAFGTFPGNYVNRA